MAKEPLSRSKRRREKLLARLQLQWEGKEGDLYELSGPEVDFFFLDDSKQNTPRRQGMGPMVAVGGINVPAEAVGSLRRELDELCKNTGFPPGEEFKWSPGRELWMHKNLLEENRARFYLAVIELLAAHDVRATVVVRDKESRSATKAESPEMDAVNLLIERVEGQCTRGQSEGFIVVDRPAGGRQDEDKFLADCLETITKGTEYVRPAHIGHNVLATPSKLSRLLQAADLVTGCTLSMVSGEGQYAPPIFKFIIPILDEKMCRIHGYGLKLHPEFRFANLYYWILGEETYWHGQTGIGFPIKDRPYASDSMIP